MLRCTVQEKGREKKKLVNLRIPRLPSALGLSGAIQCGGLDWTLDPPMCSDSPISPNPLSPCRSLTPALVVATDQKGGGMWTACTTLYFSPFDRVWVERGESTLICIRVGCLASLSELLSSQSE
eukprot:scaffold7401_cov108-Isochrysis_galbana.AAC.5